MSTSDFEPCDLCPFHDPKNCPAKNHSFYCEYIEAERNKREDLRYYTRRLAGLVMQQKETSQESIIPSNSYVPQKPIQDKSPPSQLNMITSSQWDLAVANMFSCEHRKPLPKLPGQCCKFQCNLGKGKNPMDVKQIECVRDCQLVAIGAI